MSRLTEALGTAIATGAGLGYVPKAPGTAGSLAALLAAAFLAHHHAWGRMEFALLAAGAFAIAVWAAGVDERRRGQKDPRFVVADEMVGQWVALVGVTTSNWKSWLGAFLLFRLFDIWKPFPVREAESLPGGLGIVADDVAAGLYAAILLFLAGRLGVY